MTFIRFVDHGKVIYNVWYFQKKKKIQIIEAKVMI